MSFTTTLATFNSRKLLKKYTSWAAKVDQHKTALQSLTDEELRNEFLLINSDNIAQKLFYAFAVVREACKRSLGMFPHTVQVIGGFCLYDGQLAEMKTGEGKTLTIVAPAAVLSHVYKKSVHVVTANSYLARRDAELMKAAYEFLGLTCSAIYEQQSIQDKQFAYSCDIVYGVGHEFGFDYLKDNLVTDPKNIVQKDLFTAIVDEVDSILIDEAKTPMIISGTATDQSEIMIAVNNIIKEMQASEHFTINLKKHEVVVTEKGYDFLEQGLVAKGLLATEKDLYKPNNMYFLTLLNNFLKAYCFYKKDRDYIIENDTVLLVDSGTGRKMYGRRIEEGIHEALEAKEGVYINRGTLAKAAVTYQNFFKLYQRLAGLTGTALTDADEFIEVYGLVTCVIPTNKPVARKEHQDLLYATRIAKFNGALSVIQEKINNNPAQPMLIGCGSVRDAMVLDSLMTAKGISHSLLTAANLEEEAKIISNAGTPGAITIATNMAGRGTDILLGGEKPQNSEDLDAWAQRKQQVIAAGGLFVLVTERNPLRRVDNQFAGRSARQGDPGEVQFMVSLEDDLFLMFGENKLQRIANSFNLDGGLGGNFVNKFIATAQSKAGEKGFQGRSELTKLDAVMVDQRDAIFSLRRHLLNKDHTFEFIQNCLDSSCSDWLDSKIESYFDIDYAMLKSEFLNEFSINAPFMKWSLDEEMTDKKLKKALSDFVANYVSTNMSEITNSGPLEPVLLSIIDEGWTAHLTNLSELQKNMSFKGNTGLNPVYQFHKDAFELFKSFQTQLKLVISQDICHMINQAKKGEIIARKAITPDQIYGLEAEKRWITRNEQCPCGSGKKFKFCHGKMR